MKNLTSCGIEKGLTIFSPLSIGVRTIHIVCIEHYCLLFDLRQWYAYIRSVLYAEMMKFWNRVTEKVKTNKQKDSHQQICILQKISFNTADIFSIRVNLPPPLFCPISPFNQKLCRWIKLFVIYRCYRRKLIKPIGWISAIRVNRPSCLWMCAMECNI